MLNFNIKSEENLNKEKNKFNNYYKKIILPSPEELKLHKEYLKNSLKKNFFN